MRDLAKVITRLYPFKSVTLRLLEEGENITFLVETDRGRKHLLRLHRPGYHSSAEICEELNWLERLNAAGLRVQIPQRSRRGAPVETIETTGHGRRSCSMLGWVDGRILGAGYGLKTLFDMGALIGDLHNAPRPARNTRRLWSTAGLVGARPTFGGFTKIPGVRPEQLKQLRYAARIIRLHLRVFERRFPARLGLIHADLHFGNVIRAGGRLIPIDFDDCGYGFYAYDLVAPLFSAEAMWSQRDAGTAPDFTAALYAGYASKRPWDRADQTIMYHLRAARVLSSLGWTASRSDTPEIGARLPSAIERSVAYLRRRYR